MTAKKEEENNEGKEGRWKAMWEYQKQADDINNQRTNFFLVAESMLIISFATLRVAGDESLKILYIAIVLLGIIYTFSWFYVNARLGLRMTYLIKKYLKKENPIYKRYLESVGGIYATTVEHYIIPLSTVVFWFFLLFSSTLQKISCCFEYLWVLIWLVTSVIMIIISILVTEKLPRCDIKESEKDC